MSFLSDYYTNESIEKLDTLERLWEHAKNVEPESEEGLSYGLPALKLGGRPLIGFGLHATHLSLYPFSPKIISALQSELKQFELTKGSIHFTPENPVPLEIIDLIVGLRKTELDNSGFKNKKSGIEIDAKDPIFDVMSDKEIDEAHDRINDLLNG